jgi:hypothetical protein
LQPRRLYYNSASIGANNITLLKKVDSPSSGFFTNLTPSSSNLLQAPCTSGTAIPM